MKIVNKIVLIIIKGYRLLISPLKPRTCRFYPTCSDYAYQAFSKHNFIKAFLLSITRIFKCHPFHPGGYDPLK